MEQYFFQLQFSLLVLRLQDWHNHSIQKKKKKTDTIKPYFLIIVYGKKIYISLSKLSFAAVVWNVSLIEFESPNAWDHIIWEGHSKLFCALFLCLVPTTITKLKLTYIVNPYYKKDIILSFSHSLSFFFFSIRNYILEQYLLIY